MANAEWIVLSSQTMGCLLVRATALDLNMSARPHFAPNRARDCWHPICDATMPLLPCSLNDKRDSRTLHYAQPP